MRQAGSLWHNIAGGSNILKLSTNKESRLVGSRPIRVENFEIPHGGDYLGERLVPYQYEYPEESWGEHGEVTMLDEDRAASSGHANYRHAADCPPSTPPPV